MTALSRRAVLAAALPLALSPLGAVAQSREMTIVVGYPAGGSLDAMARAIAQRLSILRGQSVVVDNKPGFSGNIGAQYVAKSAADGNTLLMTPLTTYAINSTLMGKATGYDLLRDFRHVAIVGNLPNVLMVPSSLPANSLQEFVQLARSRPGALSYATTGNGSLEHVAGEMFKRSAGIDMLAVPYKGSTPGVTDLIGGQIQAMFVNTSTAINNLKTGRVKVLGIAGGQRVAALGDVPTFREAGVVMRNDVVSIFGLAAPGGVTPEVAARLNADINAAMATPEVRSRFEALGIEVVTESGAHATQRITREIAAWVDVIRETGITAS